MKHTKFISLLYRVGKVYIMSTMKFVAFGLGMVIGFGILSVVALPVSPVIGGLIFGGILAAIV